MSGVPVIPQAPTPCRWRPTEGFSVRLYDLIVLLVAIAMRETDLGVSTSHPAFTPAWGPSPNQWHPDAVPR
jgi:hypothetical protein